MSEENLLARTLGKTSLSRRSFVKWSAVAGGATAAAGAGLSFGLRRVAQAQASAGLVPDKTVWQSCMVNCGSRCPLRVDVKDGQIVRINTDNTGDDVYGMHQVRACVRGRSIRQRVYNPDRLKVPMKRVGKRGSGEFQEITWEEAYDTIASELKRIIDEYGNEAVYINYATGALGNVVAKGWPPGSSPIARLMNCVGGYLNHYGTYSSAQISAAMPYTYGGSSNNSFDSGIESKLIVFWGNNPAETRMSGGGDIYHAQQAKKLGGAKIIVVDPRYSDTAVTIADEWVPIRPGADAALVSAMAHVMIAENLHDQEFLDKYCVGFDEEHMPEGIPAGNSYKSYILGEGPDKTAKTPAWAAPITGVPVETIVRLAREIAQAKPAMITQGLGPQRHANGENSARAIAMLAILTGNVGIQGGGTGTFQGGFSVPFTAFPTLENPVKTAISVFLWTDAIERGPEMTELRDGVRGKPKLDVPIKFMWNYAGNTIINQHSDTGRTAKSLEDDTKCEMIVVIENHMTASAKFADILLPDTTNLERNEITFQGAGNMAHAIYCERAVEPLFECRPVYEMCTEIAKRLGVEQEFTEGRTEDEWLEWCVNETRANNPDFPAFDDFREMGIYKVQNPNPGVIAFKTFRDDPEANPLKTPSGKIEIFSSALWEMSKTWELPEGDRLTALPEFTPTWEMPGDPLQEKYPLQCIGHHYKQRTHSTYGNVAWMQEAAPQEVWINPMDAKARGIKHGDRVHVYNDRGRIALPAKVTPRIAPGVLSVPQGAWYKPDANGVDQGGCVNTLTSWHPSPLAKGNPQHTNLVQVEKV